ncbi:hypothetical protein BBP40_010704 [Aspergillus hancockii]|nr:hypothetical protein BBP40_010704 [Aspergillus hancockii]
MDQHEKRKLGQSIPDHDHGVDGPDTDGKRRKVIGPTLPLPNAVDERHSQDSEGEAESSDDDDIGPSLPPPGIMAPEVATNKAPYYSSTSPSTKKDNTYIDRSHRDEWMLQPPESTGWASKVDPTKLRSRKFQTGRSAANPQSGDIDSSWTETPEQKMKRLQDKIMGVSTITPNQVTGPSRVSQVLQEKVQKYNESKRKESTAQSMSPHPKELKREDQDDPSNRPFDREKDMTISSKITNSQRREMIDRAAEFGSRFSKGNYL